MHDRPPLIAMIHAVPAAARIAQDSFAREFPEARLWNLLDDRLLDDARAAGGLDATLRRRMLRLIRHAVEGGAQGVLLTCSSYGEVVDTARTLWEIPVLKSDESMFHAALTGPYDRLAVAASTAPAVPAALTQLDDLSARLRPGRPARITAALSETAARTATPQETARHLAEALRASGGDDVQAVLLAQYSLAPAGAALSDLLGLPVLDGAGAAARELRTTLLPQVPAPAQAAQ
ncbi:aspartate/glutamate racemase family protein [Streptomyces viridochromogenes]|uniref:Putative DBF4-type zinc finger-containing protein 2-like protein n=1 Tax=Streptomyces viridochromogenes Tue57 TaxID=1160705 RepID=L8P4R7_STRVR|nr:aspartate/glutamate racemase family protein [Streptomyces viridochromogenes]ELS51108.1 putative DBF4-type zinc finger-containing protein 2-like protein [Streptomyces viridochromogenes Tue57]